MDRRSFFKNILTAAVAGVALTSSTVAMASDLGMNKYVEMIRLQQLAIQSKSGERAVTTQVMDQVFRFSMDNFTGDTTTPEAQLETSRMFNQRDYADTMSESGLRAILEVVVPIAVARYLLARERITFDARGMKSWDEFTDRYKDLILAA